MSAKSGYTISCISESLAIAISGISSDIICTITAGAGYKWVTESAVGFGT